MSSHHSGDGYAGQVDARLNNNELHVITHFVRRKPEYGEKKYPDESCD
jgi:hypothetical protein